VTQADLNGGMIENHATATGDFTDLAVAETGHVSDGDQASVTADQNYQIALVESVTPTDVTVGEDFVFAYTFTNDGNVDLTNLAFTETDFTGNGDPLDIANMTCVTGDPAVPFDLSDTTKILSPGQSVVCTIPAYTTVAADVDNADHAVISNGQIVGYGTFGEPVVQTLAKATAGAQQAATQVKATATATGYVHAEKLLPQTGGSVATSAVPMALFIGLLGVMAAAVLLIRRRGLLR